MGFLESLLGNSRETQENFGETPSAPFRLYLSFSPLRLSAMKDNSVNMVVKVTNITKDNQMVSVDANLQNRMLIGFEPTCIHKNHEKRLGEIKPGETKEIAIPIWGTNQTKEGDYTVEVTAYLHYLNYDKVIASVRKRINLRVV